MTNRQNEERARIRAARYVPGHGFTEGIEMTLNNLPRRKHASFRNKVLAGSAIAAALALLLAFTAPQIVKAATQLYQRLFGQVAEDIKTGQALPEDKKLKELIAEREEWVREHKVEGATAETGGVTVSIKAIRTAPLDKYNEGDKGELDLWLTYSAIPSFDPSWVDISLPADGKEIPMKIDEQFKAYRDEKKHTLTEAEWADEFSGSNSQLMNGELGTWLSFDVENWQWEQPKQLELKALIGGQQFSIPFAFDPVKARENTVKSAKTSLALIDDNYERKKDALESMQANAIPVGLTGSAYGYDFAISEISYADEKLYFTAAFGGVKEKNPKLVGLSFWLSDVTVDGMMTGGGNSDNAELKDGNYTAVYQYTLGRDPRNLPEESIIAVALELGDPDKKENVAFKYNWKEKKVSLPKNDAEMQAWVGEAQKLNQNLYSKYPVDIGYDLIPLNLTQEKDGVSMTIVGVNYSANAVRLEFLVKVEGDFKNSPYSWLSELNVTINDYRCNDNGRGLTGDDIPTGFYVSPPLSISEFGNSDKVVFELPLYDKDANFEHTNYPKPADTLRYEFTIDKSTLEPLKAINSYRDGE